MKRIIQTILGAFNYELRRCRSGNPHYWPTGSEIPTVFYEIDQDFHRLYDLAQVNTQMTRSDNAFRRMRHYILNCLLKTIDFTEGDACEAGCFRGLSAYQVAYHLRYSKEKVFFHIFDSFEGLSEIQEVDKAKDREHDPVRLKQQFACPLEVVMKNLGEFDFIKYYKGWIPDRFNEVVDQLFSFVHIDVDLYQPIYDSLEFFYPRLKKNGIILIDDYGYTQFPGAKKAVDEFRDFLKNDLFLPLVSGQAVIVKHS